MTLHVRYSFSQRKYLFFMLKHKAGCDLIPTYFASLLSLYSILNFFLKKEESGPCWHSEPGAGVLPVSINHCTGRRPRHAHPVASVGRGPVRSTVLCQHRHNQEQCLSHGMTTCPVQGGTTLIIYQRQLSPVPWAQCWIALTLRW